MLLRVECSEYWTFYDFVWPSVKHRSIAKARPNTPVADKHGVRVSWCFAGLAPPTQEVPGKGLELVSTRDFEWSECKSKLWLVMWLM